jgi:hypothetical protein
VRRGLSGSERRGDGLFALVSRELSCLAVIKTYFDALDPAVILFDRVDVPALVDFPRGRFARAAGVVPGVTLPEDREEVDLPLLDGVIRPEDPDIQETEIAEDEDGVIRPDMAGVTRPPRIEVTDAGRCIPTVGGESFIVATKTPQFSGHVKYWFLKHKEVSMVGMVSGVSVRFVGTKGQ